MQSNKHFIWFFDVVNDEYISTTGEKISREYGIAPNGDGFRGKWVYRNVLNEIVDFDQFRHDLFERVGLRVSDIGDGLDLFDAIK